MEEKKIKKNKAKKKV